MKTLIISEIGVNHDGSLKKLKKLIYFSKKVGADIVKLQIYNTNELIIKNSKAANYQKRIGENQFQILKKYELSENYIKNIISYCKKIKIRLFATCFDIPSFKKYSKISKSNLYKISSGDLSNLPLIFEIAKSKKRIILSTGMSSLKNINLALKTIIFAYKQKSDNPNIDKIIKIKLNKKNTQIIKKKISILHCVSSYPAKLNQLNLNYISTLKKKYNMQVGLSDHSKSLISGAIAVSLGAEVIEKHITLNNKSKGPDHLSSLNVSDFKKYVDNIRDTEKILGTNLKKINLDEKSNSKVVRKSIYARKHIKKGESFSLKNIAVKRPFNKRQPYQLWSLLGKKSKKNYREDQAI
tara:strand:+ start:40 stop:1098 length:1059 start_codon:yes stop_codon:yes gene_type:complete